MTPPGVPSKQSDDFCDIHALVPTKGTRHPPHNCSFPRALLKFKPFCPAGWDETKLSLSGVGSVEGRAEVWGFCRVLHFVSLKRRGKTSPRRSVYKQKAEEAKKN